MMIVFLLFSWSVHASDQLHDLLGARSMTQLELIQRQARERASASADCRAELRAHLLPRSCFRELKFKAGSPASGFSTNAGRITKVCIENAKLSRSHIDLGESMTDVPDECRRVAAERLEDLRYIDEAAHPETSVIRTLGPDIED